MSWCILFLILKQSFRIWNKNSLTCFCVWDKNINRGVLSAVQSNTHRLHSFYMCTWHSVFSRGRHTSLSHWFSTSLLFLFMLLLSPLTDSVQWQMFYSHSQQVEQWNKEPIITSLEMTKISSPDFFLNFCDINAGGYKGCMHRGS